MRKKLVSALGGIFLLLALCVVVIAGDHGAGNKPPKSVQPKSYANPKNTSQCLVCHGQLDYLRSVCRDEKDGYGHDIAAETVAQGLYVDAAFVSMIGFTARLPASSVMPVIPLRPMRKKPMPV